MSLCGFCYKTDPTSACGKCNKRKYCSKECQKSDWKFGHKHWCGVAGELGCDFEIRESEGKGLGVFALRNFEKNEKVMVERFVASCTDDKTPDLSNIMPESVYNAIEQLAPAHKSLKHKFHLNSMQCVDGDLNFSGLFITMSRVNHSCVGNTEHFYIHQHKVKMLLVSKPIQAGEEITFSYVHKPQFKKNLKLKWGFDCLCPACCTDINAIDNVTTPVNTLTENLKEMAALDEEIADKGSHGNVSGAVKSAKRLLYLHKMMDSSAIQLSRVYYDLYSMSICKTETFKDAVKYIKLAYEAECAVYSGCNSDTSLLGSIQKFSRYVENPKSHPNCGRGGR